MSTTRDSTREKIRKQVNEGVNRRSYKLLRDTFDLHKENASDVILASSLGPVLTDLGVRAAEIEELLKSRGIDADGELDFQEFSLLVNTPSPIEEWASELSLSQLVSDAMPRVDCPIKDQLRYLSRATTEQLEDACEIIKESLFKVLQEKVAVLKEGYEKLDSQPAAGSNSKFQICKMSVGTITDFHEGLASRIGIRFSDFFM
jgi:hypothetical protein